MIFSVVHVIIFPTSLGACSQAIFQQAAPATRTRARIHRKETRIVAFDYKLQQSLYFKQSEDTSYTKLFRV